VTGDPLGLRQQSDELLRESEKLDKSRERDAEQEKRWEGLVRRMTDLDENAKSIESYVEITNYICEGWRRPD
jgi:hypothetical protein